MNSSHLVPPATVWSCGSFRMDVSRRALVMGVINITPDSFSDGGHFLRADAAVEHGLRLAEEGADILDIGGESSRPGAEPVSVEEEMHRVIPVVERLVQQGAPPISVDTTKACVADAALRAGACIINDITALRGDADMAGVVARHQAGLVLMHMQGCPKTMQAAPAYTDVVGDVLAFLDERVRIAIASGVSRTALCVDPGFGFGKTAEHNWEMLSRLTSFTSLDLPVLVGLSRKSMLGAITGRAANDRMAAGLTAHAWAVAHGAKIIRTHDAKETCDMVRIMATLNGNNG